jgi:hypothetical protein
VNDRHVLAQAIAAERSNQVRGEQLCSSPTIRRNDMQNSKLRHCLWNSEIPSKRAGTALRQADRIADTST